MTAVNPEFAVKKQNRDVWTVTNFDQIKFGPLFVLITYVYIQSAECEYL